MTDRDTITLPREVAYQVPLHELLESVPLDARLVIDYADGRGTAFIPVGRYCHEAAKALRTALAAEPQKPSEVGELIENLMDHAYNDGVKQLKYRSSQTVEAEEALRTALAAEQPVPTVKDSLTHPGYVIGSHWLETAYSRICAGEAEADVLRDCGLERVDEALRRDAERYRWLRDNAAGFSGRTLDAITDAAIDAAMKEGT